MDELEKQYQLGVLAKAQGVPLQDYFDLETMLDLWGEAMADRKQARRLCEERRLDVDAPADNVDGYISVQEIFPWERNDGKY